MTVLPFLVGGAGGGTDVALAVVAAAFLGASLAGFLRLPKPAGYLVAGAAMGPAVTGLVDDTEGIRAAAEIGVALLLFAVGLELSLADLRSTLRPALLVGLGEVIIVGAVVFGAALLADVQPIGALILAGAAGLSSTATGVALLSRARGPGLMVAALAVGVLIVQDVLAVGIIAIVPSLDEANADVVLPALAGLLLAAVIFTAALPLASFLADLGFSFLAARVDRELFLIATLAGVGALAALAGEAGLSPALGAFVAGVLVRQSGYAHQAVREVAGLRDVFAAVFFVSAGLLFDPGIIASEWVLVLGLVVSVIGVKFAAVVLIARATGSGWSAALMLGAILANVGEFSFVVVDVADPGVLGPDEVAALVLVVVISLVVSSLAVGLGSVRGPGPAAVEAPGQVVVVGFGRLGRPVARELRGRGLPVLVVEQEIDAARRAAQEGFPTIWGDIEERGVRNRIRRPRLVVVTPAGGRGARILATVGGWLPQGSRAVATTPPAHAASLPLDLTVVDVDRISAAPVSTAVHRSLDARPEPFTLRSAFGTTRFAPVLGTRGRRRRFWPRLGRESAGEVCTSCSGRGRRYGWPVTSICTACGGSGRTPR